MTMNPTAATSSNASTNPDASTNPNAAANYLRLRQVCLAAPKLAPVVADLREIFGIEVCYRDPNVAAFGLENALLPIGTDLLEVVSPTQEHTAAGRFISRTRGHGGYMAIFQTNNPRERQAHAAAMGVRTAHEIERDAYQSAQLHPRDCRAAFIELAHSTGGDDRMGTWWPAGADWKKFVRTEQTTRMLGIEFEGSEPAGLAAHWAKILQRPLTSNNDDRITGVKGAPAITVDGSSMHFVIGASEVLSAIQVEVRDVAATLERAVACGHRITGNSFHMAGVYFRVLGA